MSYRFAMGFPVGRRTAVAAAAILALLLLGCSASAPGSAVTGSPPGASVSRTGAQSPAAAGGSSAVPAQTTSSAPVTPLVVDDAHAANPDLVSTQVTAPPGLPQAQGSLSVPPGFSVSILAAGLSSPRFMAFDPAGNLIVGTDDGSVYRYPAAGGSIAASLQPPSPILRGLQAPSSVAFHDGFLYVAETTRVTRYLYGSDGSLGQPETVISNLPSGGHFTRTAVFGPDGELYLGVGSSCNICTEQDERRAAISRYNPDGTGYDRFAWGARNAVGLAFQPSTGLLWATVNERDNQGNEIPPDLVTVVRQGDNFGWPRCRPPDATPQDPGNDCSGITPPTIGIQAHSAPLGLAFYTGSQFPSDYQGDLFVVQHGSWNRQPPAPPQILRVHFENGQPASVRAFATGWQTDDAGDRWGRPAGIIVAPDGSVIVSDDTSGFLYRISYTSG